MKKLTFSICFVFLFLGAFAQRGVEIKALYGIGGIGYDYWINSNSITLEANYNINEIIAVGPFFSTAFGSKYYIFDKPNSTDAKVTIIGLNSNLTFARVGKFKAYGSAQVFSIKASTGTFTNSQFSSYSNLEESMVSFGGGVGVMMNLGSGLVLNLFDFKLRFLKRGYLQMDQSIYRFYQFGIAYTFNSRS